MTAKKIILKWLSEKINYISYKKDENTWEDYMTDWSRLLASSRLHVDDLTPSGFYVIENTTNNMNSNIDDIIRYEFKAPLRERNEYKLTKFESFNVKENRKITNKIELIESSKNFDNNISKSIYYKKIVKELKEELEQKKKEKKRLEQKKKETINHRNIFNDIDIDSLKDFEEFTINYDIDYKQFEEEYIDKIKLQSKNIKEIGLFYPFVIDHDIFKDQYFLYEINEIRMKKGKSNIKVLIDKFYDKYGINSDTSKEIFNLEKIFMHAGVNYNKKFAYFDPFKNFTKYENKYKKIIKRMELKKIDFKSFLFELFEFLNYVQSEVVHFQHRKLINSLSTLRSKNRIMTIEELCVGMVKDIGFSNNETDQYIRQVLIYFIEEKVTKDTIVSDIPVFMMNPILRHNSQVIFNLILELLNKDDKSSLSYVFKHFKIKAKTIYTKYK